MDREQVRVLTRREEVYVERVPVNEEGTGAEIGDDEVSVPVVAEEAVLDKRPVVKEVRVRKEVVEGEEFVEEDVCKEEVDIDDVTTTTRGSGRDMHLDDESRRRVRQQSFERWRRFRTEAWGSLTKGLRDGSYQASRVNGLGPANTGFSLQ